MSEKIENINSIVQHWRDSSEHNYVTMHNLFKSKDYNWALFLVHLVIEKLLKALYVKRLKIHAIFTHDLLRLARKIDFEIPDDYEEWLDEITTFNLNARYDDYKQRFQKLCTKEFTENRINRIEILRKWLIKQF